ncbi:MAG: hypothetical protein ACO3JL_14015 [Myxococcota bacterium]
MRSAVVASLTAALGVLISSPSVHARNGGLYLEIAPAWGFFLSDEVIIEDGDDDGSALPLAGFTPSLKLGTNLFGFLGAEMNIAAHGWDLGRTERGGAGYVGGVVRATPLELLTFVMPGDLELPSLLPPGPVTWHDRPFDIGVYAGGGYHLIGEDYAYQGGYFHWGVDLKWYLTPNFAVGLDLPLRHALYEPFRYVDYADGQGFCTDGGDAYGVSGIPVPTSPARGTFRSLELNASQIESECTKDPPSATLFAPSLTITGVFDFGI